MALPGPPIAAPWAMTERAAAASLPAARPFSFTGYVELRERGDISLLARLVA